MNKKLFAAIILLSLFDSWGFMKLVASYQAVIKYPVVEMNTTLPVQDNQSVCPGDIKNCHRSHQGLFNEIVTCLQEKGDCVQVAFDTISYRTDGKPSTFWMDKKNIISMQDLTKKGLAAAIPCKTYGQDDTVVLIRPWRTFSVGTRFKHIQNFDTSDSFAVLVIDYNTYSIIFDYIPHQYLVEENLLCADHGRQLFISVLRQMINHAKTMSIDGVVPYVWGGNSFVNSHKKNDFYQEELGGGWHREKSHSLYTGYDCSGLVMRGAQIAGIDFPWKTTGTMEQKLRPITIDQELELGDLVWIPGHIMIISDLVDNKIIEARGYKGGYGCVHEISLAKIFAGINNYDDLLKAYYRKLPLQLLDKQGKVTQIYPEFKILKLID